MEKSRLPRKFRVYLPLILMFVLMIFTLPRSPKFNYDYKKGSLWKYETLVAEYDFPMLKPEEQYNAEREKVGAAKIPFYKQDKHVADQADDALSAMDLGEYSYMKTLLADHLEKIYAKGIISDSEIASHPQLQLADGVMYVQRTMRAEKVPSQEVFTVAMASDYFKESAKSSFPECNVDSIFSAAGLASLLNPDMVYDAKTTDALLEEEVYMVSRTHDIIKEGTVIVSKNELITDDIELMLDSYENEWSESVGYSGDPMIQWLGNALIALFLIAILYFAMYFTNYRIFDKFNKYLYILLVFSLSSIGTFLLARTELSASTFYLVPYTLIAYYLIAFFTKRMVLIIYMISLLPILVVVPDGVEIYLVFVVAGVAGIYVFESFCKGWQQFVTAFLVFLTMSLAWVGFRLVGGYDLDASSTFRQLAYMAVGSFLPVAGYPLIYLFERLFMLVSTSRLVELSDTSNKLLRLLADKAPGTFQHSLQVMNLADAAARSIDAYVPLVRAAALYHDIGKINNPQCFTENETPGIKYHDGLSPKESAHDITKHVTDGLALADKHNLPDVLKEFIGSHHGTTPVAFFLTKHLNEGGDPMDVSDFYYKGIKPKSKEHVILMLCDAVEAASRSLKDYSVENISALVDRIVDGKVDDDQLSDSDITIRELNTIRVVMKSYIQQMYHTRVVYPKREAK